MRTRRITERIRAILAERGAEDVCPSSIRIVRLPRTQGEWTHSRRSRQCSHCRRRFDDGEHALSYSLWGDWRERTACADMRACARRYKARQRRRKHRTSGAQERRDRRLTEIVRLPQ